MVEIIVAVVIVVEVPVWDAAIIGIVVVVVEVVVLVIIDVLVGVEFIDVVIVLKFALSVSYSGNVLSGVTVDWFMDVLTDVMIGVLTGIYIEMFAGVNATAFTVMVTALEFPVSTPLEEFSL